MHASPTGTSASALAGEMDHPLQQEDRVYQAFTIAAILLVLGSLWVF